MKVLLDENLPLSLGRALGPDLGVLTVHDLGWLNKTNGELLRAMEAGGFDLLITADKSLRHQQAIGKYRLRFIVLRGRSLDIEDLLPLVPEVRAYLMSGRFEKVVEVRYGSEARPPS